VADARDLPRLQTVYTDFGAHPASYSTTTLRMSRAVCPILQGTFMACTAASPSLTI